MKYVCGECGYEAAEPGDCPECAVPLLVREDEAEGSDDEEILEDEDGGLEELS